MEKILTRIDTMTKKVDRLGDKERLKQEFDESFRQLNEESKKQEKIKPMVEKKVRNRSRVSLEFSGPINLNPMHTDWDSNIDREKSKTASKTDFKEDDSSVLSSRERIKAREDKIKARLNDIKQRYNSRRLFMKGSLDATEHSMRSEPVRMHGGVFSGLRAEETSDRSRSSSPRKTASLIFQPSFSVNSVGRPATHFPDRPLRSSQSNSMILMSNRLGSFGSSPRAVVSTLDPYTEESGGVHGVQEAAARMTDSEAQGREHPHSRKPSDPGTILENSVSSSSSELKECNEEPGHSPKKVRVRNGGSNSPRKNLKGQQTHSSGETYDNFVDTFRNSSLSYGSRSKKHSDITIRPLVNMKVKLTPLVEVSEVSVSKDTLDVPHSRSSTKDRFVAELKTTEKL